MTHSFPQQLSLKRKNDDSIVKLTKKQEEALIGFFVSFSQLDTNDKKLIEECVYSLILPHVPSLKNIDVRQQLKLIDLQKTSPGGAVQYLKKRNWKVIGVIAAATLMLFTSKTFYDECKQEFKTAQKHAFLPTYQAHQALVRRNESQAIYKGASQVLNTTMRSPFYESLTNKIAQLQIIQGRFSVKKIPLIGGVISSHFQIEEPTPPQFSEQERRVNTTVHFVKGIMHGIQQQQKITPKSQLQAQYVKRREYYHKKALPELQQRFQTCLTGQFSKSARLYSALGHSLMILAMIGIGDEAFSHFFDQTHSGYIRLIVGAFASAVYGYKTQILNNYSIIFQHFILSIIKYCTSSGHILDCASYTIQGLFGLAGVIFFAWLARQITNPPLVANMRIQQAPR